MMIEGNKVNKELAPIVLFTYNRPWHTQQTIEALEKNELASQSEIFIFSDGGKDEISWQKVYEVRDYLKSINGFRKITLTFQERNIGLADSIISGVTKIVNEFGKIIVLEDDMVTSPYFLKFMNESLEFYKNKEKVWQVGGWFFPIEKSNLNKVIVHNVMNCWGWGTWKDRWKYFDKNPQKLLDTYKEEDIYKFNLEGADLSLWWQVILNYRGSINSWAIFWHEIIFKKGGLYINPRDTLIKNIGIDGSGIHHDNNDIFISKLNTINYDITFNNKIVQNNIAVDRIKIFFYKIRMQKISQLPNANMSFSIGLNKIVKYINDLQCKNDKFILYGSGTGMNMVLNYFDKNNLLFILDKDKNKHGSYIENIKVISLDYLNIYDDNKTKIIITTFGRARLVKSSLIKDYDIDKDRIISLDILDEK